MLNLKSREFPNLARALGGLGEDEGISRRSYSFAP